jgi:hypothetical protein
MAGCPRKRKKGKRFHLKILGSAGGRRTAVFDLYVIYKEISLLRDIRNCTVISLNDYGYIWAGDFFREENCCLKGLLQRRYRTRKYIDKWE